MQDFTTYITTETHTHTHTNFNRDFNFVSLTEFYVNNVFLAFCRCLALSSHMCVVSGRKRGVLGLDILSPYCASDLERCQCVP